ncbi:enkurin isoform X1 [Turdus rufiventris]|nr:enkurin isoform X1 [Turdus rufiventris]
MATQSAPEGTAGPPPRPAQPGKPARYISKYSEHVRREAEKNKSQWKTMGPAKVAVPSPNDFLQKRSKEPKLAPNTVAICVRPLEFIKKSLALDLCLYCFHVLMMSAKKILQIDCSKAMAYLALGTQGVSNGETWNSVMNECLLLRKDKQGGREVALRMKELFKYMKFYEIGNRLVEPNYGVIPKYVTRRNEEMKKEEEEYQASVLENLKKKAMKTLSEEERTNILKALKKNWEEINRAFQTLPIVTDTRYKKMHKEELELKLKQLEHDIAAIEKHKTIYIANV